MGAKLISSLFEYCLQSFCWFQFIWCSFILSKTLVIDFISLFKHLIYFCLVAVKNGVYIMLVKDAGDAFGRSRFVKIDCKGLDPGDYKKLGSKHKVLHNQVSFFSCRLLILCSSSFFLAQISLIFVPYISQ